ncbi:MAG: hypothetical protein ACFFEU_08140 [Candidatus Thorarchaeota archaeon]
MIALHLVDDMTAQNEHDERHVRPMTNLVAFIKNGLDITLKASLEYRKIRYSSNSMVIFLVVLGQQFFIAARHQTKGKNPVAVALLVRS